jgi:hypothetical protein
MFDNRMDCPELFTARNHLAEILAGMLDDVGKRSPRG